MKMLPLILTALLTVSGESTAAIGQTRLNALLQQSSPVSVDEGIALYREAILDEQGLEGVVDALQPYTQCDNANTAVCEQAGSLLGYLHWQSGNIDAALATLTPLVENTDSTELLVLYRQLNDAIGQTVQADMVELAGLSADMLQDENRLFSWAQQQPADVQYRVAKVLAIQGFVDTALRVMPAPSNTTQQLTRIEWLLQTSDYQQAAAEAQQLVPELQKEEAKRYALALWVEAYREQAQLADIVPLLEAMGDDKWVQHTLVDVLLELQRGQAALVLVKHSEYADVQVRVSQILSLQGDTAALASLYQTQIADAPQNMGLYKGLAALYLSEGKEAEAKALYRNYVEHGSPSSENVFSLVFDMQALGLTSSALALLQQYVNTQPELAVTGSLTRFELLMLASRRDDAQAVLALLGEQLSRTDSRRFSVAAGFSELGLHQAALDVVQPLTEASVTLTYDQQLKVAQLREAAGDDNGALTDYRFMLANTQLPARAHLLVQRLVKLAQKSGSTDTLITEFSAKLAEGRLTSPDLALLTRLLLTKHQVDKAIEAVSTFAANNRLSRTQTLSLLIPIYAKVNDHVALEESYQTLADIDPDNASQHVRNLALTVLSQADAMSQDARTEQVNSLLTQLQHSQGEAGDVGDTFEFAAGLYTMANMGEQAIQAYQKTLAANPDNADNWLLMTALMMKQQRIFEAIHQLQFQAIYAPNRETFEVAIDGLLNMFAGSVNQLGKETYKIPQLTAMLSWAKQRVLLRIISKGDNDYLYNLLGDIAQEQRDFVTQGRVLQTVLSEDMAQLPYRLRQLVTLFSGEMPSFQNQGPAIGNVNEKLRFGRRLLAMSRAFPPDFYADLANTLVKQGDIGSAQLAFAMMDNIDGLVNVGEVKGQTYDDAGLITLARDSFANALVRDQNNIGLALRTAILQEQLGQTALAHRIYWQGIKQVMASLSYWQSAPTDPTPVEVGRYLPSLVEGWLLTWPEKAQERAHNIEEILALLDKSVAATLANREAYQRDAKVQQLAHWQTLALRVMSGFTSPEQLAAIVDVLAPAHKAIPSLAREWRYSTTQFGLIASPVTSDSGWSEHFLQARIELTDNAIMALAIALEKHDNQAILTLVEHAIAQENERLTLMERGTWYGYPSSQFDRILANGYETLSTDDFIALILTPLQKSPQASRILFDLFRGMPTFFEQVEQKVGQTLLSNEQLMRLFLDHGSDPYTYSQRGGASVDEILVARLNLAEQIQFYQALLARAKVSGGESGLASMLFERLLTSPLTAQQKAVITQVFGDELAGEMDEQVRNVNYFVTRVLRTDIPASNQAMLFDLAQLVAARFPAAQPLPRFLHAFYQQDRKEAYHAILALYYQVQQSSKGGIRDFSSPIIDAHYADLQQQEIDYVLQADSLPDPVLADFYQRFVVPLQYRSQPEAVHQSLIYLEKLHQLAPDNAQFLVAYLAVLMNQQGRNEESNAAITEILYTYLRRHDFPLEATATLYYAYRAAGNHTQAAAIKADTGYALDDQDVVVALLNQGDQRGRVTSPFLTLFSNVFKTYLDNHQHDAALAPLAERFNQSQPGQSTPYLQRLTRAIDAHAQGQPWFPIWQGVWRHSIAMGNTSDINRQQLLLDDYWLDDDGQLQRSRGRASDEQPIPAIKTLLLTEQGTQALLQYLQAMEYASQRYFTKQYDWLAEGLYINGLADEQRATLDQALLNGQLSAHQLQLWLAMQSYQPQALSTAQYQALNTVVEASPLMAVATLQQVFALFAEDVNAHPQRLSATLNIARALVWAQLFDSGASVRGLYSLDKGLASVTAHVAAWRSRDAKAAFFVMLSQALKQSEHMRRSAEVVENFLSRTEMALGLTEDTANVTASSTHIDTALLAIEWQVKNGNYEAAFDALLALINADKDQWTSRTTDFSAYSALYSDGTSRNMRDVQSILRLLLIQNVSGVWQDAAWQAYCEQHKPAMVDGRVWSVFFGRGA